MPWERLGGKVTSCQTGRLAVIYVRQSTKQQVIDHSESTRLQYALAGRAAAMGWAAARIMVIDDDLGKSGSSAVDRAGFQRLVTEISLGHVGLVLGTEMSRLARSGKDWYQLIELCALAGALLAAHKRAWLVAGALGIFAYVIGNAIFGGSAEYVALQLKDWKVESAFFWYVTAMIALSLIVYWRMRDTKRHSLILED